MKKVKRDKKRSRSYLELFKLLLEELESTVAIPFGLCNFSSRLLDDGYISYLEYIKLANYFYSEVKPVNNFYLFTPGDKESRIKWLQDKIKKLETKKKSHEVSI